MGKNLLLKESFLSNPKSMALETKARRKLYKPLSEFAWRPASKEERERERVPSLQMLKM